MTILDTTLFDTSLKLIFLGEAERGSGFTQLVVNLFQKSLELTFKQYNIR